MTQTTNNENDNSYTWARRPGSPSEYREPVEAQAATTEFARPDGSGDGPHYPWRDAPAPAQPAAPTYAAPGYAAPGYAPTPAGPAHEERPTPPAAGSPWLPGGGAFDHRGEPENPSGSGPLPPAPPSGRGPRQPRRPGWGGVLAVGAGAAALSSLLTAGIVLQTQDDPAGSAKATTSSSSSQPAVRAPVSGSSASLPDWGSVAKAVEPSVVSVQVSSQSASGEGSGVILDKDGRIVTNNHVVSGGGSGAKIDVVLNDGRTYPATVLGTDASTDLAVIKLNSPPSDLTPAVLGDSSAVGVGDPVMAVGNPLGLAGTVTTGIVSATDRPTTTQAESQDPTQAQGEQVVTNAIQTDAAVNPGNSGGALVDAQGRVIGIPSSIASLSSGSAFGQSGQSGSIGLGFAIPVDEVKDVSSQLIKGGSVSHAWLGVGPQDGTVTADGATRDAAVLKTISAGGPADKAGLKVNDAIVKVDGETVNSALSLVGQLRERQAGASVTLTVVRDGKASDIEIVLGTRPASPN